MARDTIKGITVAIGGDTAGLQKALGEVNGKAGTLRSELRQVENALKFDPTNTTLLAQKQQILAEQVANTSAKLEQLKSVQERVEQRYQSGEIGADAYRVFQRELVSTENQLKNLANQQTASAASVDETANSMDSAADKARSLATEMSKIDNALKLDPTNVTLLAQKQAVLSQQTEIASEKLYSLRDAQAEVERKFQNGEIGDEEYREFQREVLSAENALRGFGEQQTQLNAINGGAVAQTESLSDVSKRLANEMSEVDKALRSDANNSELLQQKHNILSQQIDVTSTELEGLREAQIGVDRAFQNGDLSEEEYRAFRREVINVEGQLRTLEEQQDELNNSSEEMSEETEDVAKEMDKAKDKTNSFGNALEATKKVASGFGSAMGTVAKGVGTVMTATSTAVLAAGTAATSVGKEFESSMSQIAATMGTSVDKISGLEEKAKELGATTQFSATEAAEGLNVLAMSGLSAEEQTAAIGDVLNLAAAGSLTLENAASYTTGAVKGFGDSMENAQKYTDLMAKGATLANTDVNGLGEALSTAAASANSYGQDADGVTLSLLRLAEQNVTGSGSGYSAQQSYGRPLYTDGCRKSCT